MKLRKIIELFDRRFLLLIASISVWASSVAYVITENPVFFVLGALALAYVAVELPRS